MLRIFSEKKAARLVDENPTELCGMVNSLGQTVRFFEHPVYGEGATVIGKIEGVYFDTDFFETDDMTAEHGDYAPELHIEPDGTKTVYMHYEKAPHGQRTFQGLKFL